MSRPVRVLYEDSHQLNERNFGPHILALQCVCDAMGGTRDVWTLNRRVVALCRNGVSKLIADARLIDDAARKVLAPDEDRIREHLALAVDATEERVITELAHRDLALPSQIVLIVRNMDDVALAAAVAIGRSLTPGKPSPRDRDAVCQALATPDNLIRRQQFLMQMPSFAKLVACLCAVLERTASP